MREREKECEIVICIVVLQGKSIPHNSLNLLAIFGERSTIVNPPF